MAESTEARPRQIHVVGQGQVRAAPDLALISLGASVLRDRPDVAFERAARLIAASIASMQDNGVPADRISTTSLNLAQEFHYPPKGDGRPEPAGWRVRHHLSVQVRDFGTLGRVLADAVLALEDAGEVLGVHFTVEHPEALLAQARELALRDAQGKAEQIAAVLGLRLGAVASVREISGVSPRPMAMMDMAARAAATPAQVTPGETEVSARYDVLYDLQGP